MEKIAKERLLASKCVKHGRGLEGQLSKRYLSDQNFVLICFLQDNLDRIEAAFPG
jgi:hypothetical protein